MLPTTFSLPRLTVFSTLLCLFVFFFQSSSSHAFFTSLFTQSSHLSLGLPRLLLPCSHNSVALFGSLSSAILFTCLAHCNLLLKSLSTLLNSTLISHFLNSHNFSINSFLFQPNKDIEPRSRRICLTCKLLRSGQD